MIITEQDLVIYLQRPLTQGESTAASPLIEMVQAELEHGVLKRSLEIATHSQTLYATTSNDGIIEVNVTHTPIISVSSLSIDGQTVDTYIVERSRILVNDLSLEESQREVQITYTAGLGDPALTACKRVVLACVARILEKGSGDELGLDSVSVESYSAAWASEGFTDEERQRVSRWRRRVVS